MNWNTMTRSEIEAEINVLREKMRKAEMMGVENEYRVIERQIIIAECHLVDISKIEKGKIYPLKDDNSHYFKVDYLKGLFAWGFFIGGNEAETGIPVSLLKIGK